MSDMHLGGQKPALGWGGWETLRVILAPFRSTHNENAQDNQDYYLLCWLVPAINKLRGKMLHAATVRGTMGPVTT